MISDCTVFLHLGKHFIVMIDMIQRSSKNFYVPTWSIFTGQVTHEWQKGLVILVEQAASHAAMDVYAYITHVKL